MVAGGRGSGRSGAHAAAPAASTSSQQQQQQAASSRKQRAVLACIVESTGRACSGGGKAAQLVPPWVAYLLQDLHYSTAGTGVQALHRGREWDMEVISVHVHALVRFLRYRAA